MMSQRPRAGSISRSIVISGIEFLRGPSKVRITNCLLYLRKFLFILTL